MPKILKNVSFDTRYIEYGKIDYLYVKYKYNNRSGYALRDYDGSWYSHTGNGEPECLLSAWACTQLDNFIERKEVNDGN